MGGELSAHPARIRAGALLLALATNSVNRRILRRLESGSTAFLDGHAMQITATGRELLHIAFLAERWLELGPSEAHDPDSEAGERALTALVEGWSAAIPHALAREPRTLTGLDRAINGIGRAELARRLDAMRRAGLVEARPGPAPADDGTLYAATDWLRAAIGPLAASARLERRRPVPEMTPIDCFDVEAAFLLTLPLVELPIEAAGSCRFAVEVDDEETGAVSLAGVTARIEAGRVVSCSIGLEYDTDAWAIGGPGEWLDTVIEPDAHSVASGGNRLLARLLLDGLHRTLFGVPVAHKKY